MKTIILNPIRVCFLFCLMLIIQFPAPLSAQSCSGTKILNLGNGNDGEGIAFNPNDGLIYHTSGISNGQEYFEALNTAVPSVGPNIVPSNTYPGNINEIFGIGWYPPLNAFVIIDIGTNVASITSSGVVTALPNLAYGSFLRGFALAGSDLLGVNPFGSNLVRFNPITGATVSNLTITLLGNPVNGANGIATSPVNGKTYVLFKNGGSNRSLGEIDINTGVITNNLGALGCCWAGITFDATGQMFLLKGDGGGNGLYTNFACAPPVSAVPTLSEWGLIVLGLSFLSIGGIFLFRRRSSFELAS